MKLALTGATGLVGHFILRGSLAAGDELITLGRRAPDVSAPLRHVPFDLSAPDVGRALEGADALVHAAFSHVDGRYRGGEGDDPTGFLGRNRDGSLALFAQARAAGLKRIVFLSSRAVYGDYPPGTVLDETLALRPDTLYGALKAEIEEALAGMAGLASVSLRATGIYGPPPRGRRHKWAGLFEDFAARRAISPRAGTEVHGDDLAAAVRLALTAPEAAVGGRAFNVSDFVLDRRDLLDTYREVTGVAGALPKRADASKVSAMATGRLRALGWRARGRGALAGTLREIDARPGC